VAVRSKLTNEASGEAGNHRSPDPVALGPSSSPVIAALTRQAEQAFSEPLVPGLYLVATPIGNLSDITVRALQVLAQSDVIYCEDTRHSRTLLERFQIKTPLKPYHEHNAARQRPVILKALNEKARISLISDAGTPLISDPGFKIVREAAEAGHLVVSVPGASAVLAGVTSSGLPTDTMLFAGFLNTKSTARRKRIAQLSSYQATLIFFEAANRLSDTLQDLLAELGDRQACIARELTKFHEELIRGQLSTLVEDLEHQTLKGECVIIVGPPEKSETTDEDLIARLETMLLTRSLKDSARALADELKIPKGRVYDLGLTLKHGDR